LSKSTSKSSSAIVKADKAVNVGFMVDKMTLDRFLCHCLGFTPSISLPFYHLCIT